MFSALPTARQDPAPHGAPEAEHPDTIETRLWLEEHEWLYGLLRSSDNVSPTFRFPDLISAFRRGLRAARSSRFKNHNEV